MTHFSFYTYTCAPTSQALDVYGPQRFETTASRRPTSPHGNIGTAHGGECVPRRKASFGRNARLPGQRGGIREPPSPPPYCAAQIFVLSFGVSRAARRSVSLFAHGESWRHDRPACPGVFIAQFPETVFFFLASVRFLFFSLFFRIRPQSLPCRLTLCAPGLFSCFLTNSRFFFRAAQFRISFKYQLHCLYAVLLVYIPFQRLCTEARKWAHACAGAHILFPFCFLSLCFSFLLYFAGSYI